MVLIFVGTFAGSDHFERFKDFSFPFLADLFIEMTTNGKTQKLNLLNFKEVVLKKS